MSEILQRALRNVLANWPLMLLRVAEGIIAVIVIVIGIVAAAIPVILLFGIHADEFNTPDEFFAFYQSNPGTVMGAIMVAALVFGVILIAAIAVHAFVQAGAVGIYLDAEEAAPPGAQIAEFRRFDFTRFLDYGRRAWLPVFWIYNLAWGAYGAVLLVPLIFLLLMMILYKDVTPVIVGGCIVAAFVVIVAVLAAIVLDLWVQVATVLAVRTGRNARESLADSLALAKRQFGLLLLAVAVRFGVSFASQAVFSTFYFGIGAASSVPFVGMILLPFHIMLIVAQMAVGFVVQHWFIAAVVAISVIPPERPKHAAVV